MEGREPTESRTDNDARPGYLERFELEAFAQTKRWAAYQKFISLSMERAAKAWA